MLLTEAFPIRGTSPAEQKPYFDRESDTVTPTVSEAKSVPTVQNPKRGAKQVRGTVENRVSSAESTTNTNANPKEGRQACLRRGGEMA